MGPLIAVALLLRSFLHGKVTDQAKEQPINEKPDRTDERRAKPARSPIFLHDDKAEQQFARRASVKALADRFQDDHSHQAKNDECQPAVGPLKSPESLAIVL